MKIYIVVTDVVNDVMYYRKSVNTCMVITLFISSPEPKAHRGAYRIGRHPVPSVVVVHHFQRSSSLKLLGQSKPNFI